MSTVRHSTVNTESAPKAIGPYVQATKIGSLVFTSGSLGFDPATMKLVDGGVEAQTAQALKNLSAVLEASGSDLTNVVKCTVFIKDMNDFPKINAVYATTFEHAGNKPARSCVEVARLPVDALVEIEAIASVPN